MRKLLRILIRIYQICLSPLLGGQCRFVPSCSTYAMQAIDQFGPVKGSFKAIVRILRCNPLSKGGYDPVIK